MGKEVRINDRYTAEIGTFVIVKRRGPESDHRITTHNDTTPAQIIGEETLLVWSPYGPPRVEFIKDYEIRAIAVEKNELNHLLNKNNQMNVYNNYLLQKLNEQIKIEKIVQNDCATIVFFSDKSKIVVKKDLRDKYFDSEKAVAIACAKKMLGGYTPLKDSLKNMYK